MKSRIRMRYTDCIRLWSAAMINHDDQPCCLPFELPQCSQLTELFPSPSLLRFSNCPSSKYVRSLSRVNKSITFPRSRKPRKKTRVRGHASIMLRLRQTTDGGTGGNYPPFKRSPWRLWNSSNKVRQSLVLVHHEKRANDTSVIFRMIYTRSINDRDKRKKREKGGGEKKYCQEAGLKKRRSRDRWSIG